MTLPILVDVDGVLADFNKPLLSLMNRKHNLSLSNDDVVEFHMQKCFSQYWDQDCENLINGQYFCFGLDLISGAKDGVAELRRQGFDVLFTTSPLTSNKYWHHERQKWLERHFDASYKDVIFAHQKKYVQGATLIDDRFQNVKEWSKFNNKPAVLLSCPWNKDEAHAEKETKFHTALCWNGIIKKVQQLK